MNNIKQIDVSGHRYDICDANMRAAVTDEYDVLTAYTMGDFCIFNNVLYRCLEDTTGAWQEEKWEKKTLAEMYKEMEIMTHISDAFSALKKYTAGKYCIYENTLYRFTGTKEAGEWDPAKVVATSVDAEIGALNENISKKQDASTAITTENIGQQSVLNASIAHSVAWDDVYSKPTTGYPPSSHTHDDRYYTESEVNNLLNGKAASSHTHDDRYYTESEVNNLVWNEIHVKEYSADNVSVSTGTKTQEFSIALSGYWIVGLVQASIENASSGGINSSQCSIYGYGFYSQSTAYVRFRAWADAKVKVIIKVLYWKDPR